MTAAPSSGPAGTARDALRLVEELAVEVPATGCVLGAQLFVPSASLGAVIIAHPSGIGRLAREERFGADRLAKAGFLTVLVDLLSEDEDTVRRGAHADVALLADRLLCVAQWLAKQAPHRLPLGYLGVGHAAAAALVAAAIEPRGVGAVVSRNGQPTSAGAALVLSQVPALFLVPADDDRAVAANRAACGWGRHRQLEVIAPHHATDRMVALSQAWFSHWFEPLHALDVVAPDARVE